MTSGSPRIKVNMDLALDLFYTDAHHIAESLDDLRRELSKLPPRFGKRLEPTVRTGFMDNFRAQAAGAAYPWKPLAIATLVRRKQMGFSGRPILVNTGRYRDSWTRSFHANALFVHKRSGSTIEFEYGSSDSRVPLLEGGGINTSGHKVPARSVSLMPGAAERRIGDQLDMMFDEIGKRHI